MSGERQQRWQHHRQLLLIDAALEVDVLDIGNKGELFIYNHITQQGFLFRRVYEIAHFLLFLLFLFHSDNVAADTMYRYNGCVIIRGGGNEQQQR